MQGIALSRPRSIYQHFYRVTNNSEVAWLVCSPVNFGLGLATGFLVPLNDLRWPSGESSVVVAVQGGSGTGNPTPGSRVDARQLRLPLGLFAGVTAGETAVRNLSVQSFVNPLRNRLRNAQPYDER